MNLAVFPIVLRMKESKDQFCSWQLAKFQVKIRNYNLFPSLGKIVTGLYCLASSTSIKA